MINEQKTADMTRMAAYEAREGREDMQICSYFKSDYVGFQMLKTWICTTIAFVIILACYVLYEMDSLMGSLYELNLDGMVELGKKFVWIYLIVCGIYLLITYVIAHLKYKKAHRSLVLFDRGLSGLDGNEEEE